MSSLVVSLLRAPRPLRRRWRPSRGARSARRGRSRIPFRGRWGAKESFRRGIGHPSRRRARQSRQVRLAFVGEAVFLGERRDGAQIGTITPTREGGSAARRGPLLSMPLPFFREATAGGRTRTPREKAGGYDRGGVAPPVRDLAAPPSRPRGRGDGGRRARRRGPPRGNGRRLEDAGRGSPDRSCKNTAAPRRGAMPMRSVCSSLEVGAGNGSRAKEAGGAAILPSSGRLEAPFLARCRWRRVRPPQACENSRLVCSVAPRRCPQAEEDEDYHGTARPSSNQMIVWWPGLSRGFVTSSHSNTLDTLHHCLLPAPSLRR